MIWQMVTLTCLDSFCLTDVSIDDQMSIEMEAESLSLVLDLVLNVLTESFIQFPLKGTWYYVFFSI